MNSMILRDVWRSKAQLVMCVILGVAFGIGQSYLSSSTLLINFTLIACSVVAFLFFSFLFALLNMVGHTQWKPRNRLLSWILVESASSRQLVLRVATVLLIAWLPYLVLMYPGNLSNDTTGQLTMFYTLMGYGERWITAHHPVFDTLVFGAIAYPFYAIGHFRIGVFVCIAIQGLMTAASFGVAFAWMRKRLSISDGIFAIVLGFMALCPVVPLMVCSLSKDTFFSWIYLLWLVFFVDCVIVGRVDRRHFLALAVTGALMVLTKKYGFFVASISLAVLAISFFAKKELRTTLISLALVLVVGISNWLIVPAINAVTHADPGYKSDTLIVPIQQVAMAYSRYPEDFSSDDLNSVSLFVNINAIDSGNWYQTNTDSIKMTGDPSVPGGYTDEQIHNFLAIWARIGMMHPDAYVDGWLTLEAPLFSFGKVVPLFNSLWHTWARPSVIPDQYFEKSTIFTQLSTQMNSWYSWLTSVPGIDLLLTQTLYAVLVPAYFAVNVLRRNKSLLPVIAPVVVSFLGLLVSPMVQPHFETMRYLIPFVYSTPVLLCLAWSQNIASQETETKAI